jgi:BirA family biotin operon repressor/biotin-[acetyl-CoA-carboxylase] ligase
MDPVRVHQLTMAAGLACADAVEAHTSLRPSLKWPNDLVLRGRKLAGILTELETIGERLAFAVVGVGLNVNVDFGRHDGSGELRDTAIGLSQALGRPVDRLTLLGDILARLETRCEALGRDESLHEEWSDRLVTLGRCVQVAVGAASDHGQGEERILEGEAVGVDQSGALLLRVADGRVLPVLAGDVAHCRVDVDGR